jgi:hypothetical protein
MNVIVTIGDSHLTPSSLHPLLSVKPRKGPLEILRPMEIDGVLALLSCDRLIREEGQGGFSMTSLGWR